MKLAIFELIINLMISLSSIPAHSPSVVFRKINEEFLLIPLTDNIADMDSLYRLTETGAFIWELIDGVRTISDITEKMVEEFDVGQGIAEKDTLDFFGEIEEFIHFSAL